MPLEIRSGVFRDAMTNHLAVKSDLDHIHAACRPPQALEADCPIFPLSSAAF